MYSAHFEIQQQKWIQGVIHFNLLPLGVNKDQNEWNDALNHLVKLSETVPNAVIALRVQLTSETLLRTLFVIAPETSQNELHRWMASFTRLETYAIDSITIPSVREDHDKLIEDIPIYRCHLTFPTYSIAGVFFPCDFRIATMLDDLASRALIQGYTFTYQVNICDYNVTREDQKEANKNYLKILNLDGVTEELRNLQRRILNKLGRSSALCEEFIATELPDATMWIQKELKAKFRESYGMHKYEDPFFEFIEGAYEEAFLTGMNTAVLTQPSTSELCSLAIDKEEKISLLTWMPSTTLIKRFANISSFVKSEALIDSSAIFANISLPAVCNGRDDDYIFVSYNHGDLPRIATVLESIDEQGYGIWYDKKIPGGTEWDEIIETKIAKSMCLLLFVSPNSINSKYVRREVKFADLVNKTILACFLEKTNLQKGMKMLLTQYQFLDITSPDFSSQFHTAIEYIRSCKADRNSP